MGLGVICSVDGDTAKARWAGIEAGGSGYAEAERGPEVRSDPPCTSGVTLESYIFSLILSFLI